MKYILRAIVLCIPLIFVGAGCFSGDALTPPEPVTLRIWRVEDDESVFQSAMTVYKTIYPYVSFEYETYTAEEYEDALLAAWAKGEGPDIFSVPNWRLGKYREFITPMPEKAEFRIARTESTLGKKETIVEPRAVTFPTITQLQDRFVDVVHSDVVYESEVYGMPLSMDTLALYYNRDVMARGQVAVAPTTWEEFRIAVQAISTVDNEKNIVLPAAALGTADNIPHYFDIISLIMMQNGAQMMNANSVTFQAENEERRFPGVEALNFYKFFSDPKYKTYTWNDKQPQAIEAFTQGTLGFYFGYYSDRALIEERAPNLNFSVGKFPQIDTGNPINYANYRVETVHINSEHAEQAWDFVNFMTSPSQAEGYVTLTGKIPAVRELVGAAQTDPNIGVFAQQALTAESWYHGTRPDTAHRVFADMINTLVLGTQPIEDIVNSSASQVQLTIQ